MCLCVLAYLSTYIYIYVYVCMCIYMYVYMCVCMRTFLHEQNIFIYV